MADKRQRASPQVSSTSGGTKSPTQISMYKAAGTTSTGVAQAFTMPQDSAIKSTAPSSSSDENDPASSAGTLRSSLGESGEDRYDHGCQLMQLPDRRLSGR